MNKNFKTWQYEVKEFIEGEDGSEAIVELDEHMIYVDAQMTHEEFIEMCKLVVSIELTQRLK